MRSRNPVVFLLLLLSLVPAAEGTAWAARKAAFWACSDGRGTVSLFWLPVGGQWPRGGYRLERLTRGKNVAIADGLHPGGDSEALAGLDPGDAEEIRRLAGRIAGGTLTDDDRRTSITVMGRTAAANMGYGRALGVRHTDRGGSPGKRTYRLAALEADGTAGSEVESNEVDPRRRTPGPGRPVGVRAEARLDGVALYWNDPPADGVVPIVAFHVERVGNGGRYPLTSSPFVLNRALKRGLPEFMDVDAPRETLVYEVRGIDIFGRRSDPVSVRVGAADFPPLDPPRNVAATARDGGVEITWSVPDNTNAVGYIVERSRIRRGPYNVFTPTSLPRETARYEDRGIPAGTPYYYRLRSVGPRGDLGPPSTPVLARTEAGGPAAPDRRAAGTESVPISDELLEKQENPAGHAAPPEVPAPPEAPAEQPAAAANTVPRDTNPDATASPQAPASAPVAATGAPDRPSSLAPALNPYAREKYGALVKGDESAVSTPDEPAGAAPGDREPEDGGRTPAPVIVSLVGMDGKVSMTLKPGPPDDRTRGFIVLRSETAGSVGVAIGRTLPAETRTWEDTTVAAGGSYWYRLVAVGKTGDRSAPSAPRWVRVESR